ncbi:hypothetical protein [Mycobacteroides chelonae]|uniref:hypothetical protein n=1 Tax=Mycobacteroides chelonae TaxID=1774 RepID=UPI000991B8FE|nr:hypothetical protein [Mycobacteroides chelonae]
MTGRERIEQAAKESGFTGYKSILMGQWNYRTTTHEARVKYNKAGNAISAYLPAEPRAITGKDVAGQVIAYLQQHKETN